MRRDAIDPATALAAAPGAAFAWIDAEHPFAPRLRELAELIDADPTAQALLRAGRDQRGNNGRLQIHAEVKAGRGSDGRWLPTRFYWSAQLRDPLAPLGLRARTLCWNDSGNDGDSAAGAEAVWRDLPVDDRLPQAAPWLDALGGHSPGQIKVLRYVPLRRLTLACPDAQGEPSIGKFKRRSRFEQAHRLIGHIDATVAAGQPGFVVARPGACDAAHGLYFQSRLPGDDLADWLSPLASQREAGLGADDATAAVAMAQVGRIHARLHRLHPARGATLPHIEPTQWLGTAQSQLELITLLRPACAQRLEPLVAALRHRPLWQPQQARLCHGDLVCSQFLVDGLTAAQTAVQRGTADGRSSLVSVLNEASRWAITDFDLCHLGDPCRDIAILLASLAYDLPGLAELDTTQPHKVTSWIDAISRTYLQAYADEAGATPPAQRLAWHGLCAEIHYLALMLSKDRFHPAAFERRLQRALTLAGSLT